MSDKADILGVQLRAF